MTATPPLSAALLTTDPYARQVVALLLGFFADSSPWRHRLWDVSSVLALQEAVEAGDWVRKKVLTPGALTSFTKELQLQLREDSGLGDSQLHKKLLSLLEHGLAPDSGDRRGVIHLMPMITNGYLSRWKTAVDSEKRPASGRLARAIATHLLDCGHSSGELHSWAEKLSEQPDATLADILDDAIKFADQDDREFDVLVPFIAVTNPQNLEKSWPEWYTPQRTSAWFAEHNFDKPYQNGAFRYKVTAKDTTAAARTVRSKVLRLQNYWSYSQEKLKPGESIWIVGYPKPLPLDPPRRMVKVTSLQDVKTMYAVSQSDRLGEALELAAPLDAGPAASAVAGAWAAIESLLCHPGDIDNKEGRVVAADRLASIVTCSWPRAELTALSFEHKPSTPDKVSDKLETCRNKLQRCDVIVDALSNGTELALESLIDIAAAERMKVFLRNPRSGLQDINRTVQGVLRRLYRQRNIVVHGGTTAAIGLDAALRTSAPLIGAGLDRIVKAQLSNQEEPLDLAARAGNSLALVDDPLGPAVTRLLE